MATPQLVTSLCLLLLLFDASIAQNPTLTVRFRDTDLVPGEGMGTSRIDCIIADLDLTDVFTSDPIRWFHNDSIHVQDSSRITVDDDIPNPRPSTLTSTLVINDVVITDAGEYECRVSFNTPPGLQLEGRVVLRVAVPVSVYAEPEQEAIEGGNAELLCTVTSSPPPTITWFRTEENGGETELERRDSDDPNFGNLSIPNVDRSDAGQYKCEGSYALGGEFVLIDLIVLTVPEITGITQAETAFLKGDTISVDCDAEGMRAPMYSWLFEGEELESVNRTDINNGTGMLSIEDATFHDAGSYNCVVVNEVGNDTKEVLIQVVGSPEILHPFNRTVDVIVSIDTTAELICPYLAYPPPIVLWYATDNQGVFQQLGEDTDDRYSFDTENATLTIENVRSDDAKTYLCNVSNDYGNDTRELELTVIEPPLPPENLVISSIETAAVTLEWNQAVAPDNREVDEFVPELLYGGMPWMLQDDQTFPGNTTSGLLELIPGNMYQIRLRARNIGGVSHFSNVVEHNTSNSLPKLEFFNATAEDGGRSILLQWELAFDGGPPVEQFRIEVFRDNETEPIEVLMIEDIFVGMYLLIGLDPTTTYIFSATAVNAVGETNPYIANATTTLAPPSKPTKPDITQNTARAITFTFSVEFGSSPITHFILNITEDSTSDSQKNISVDSNKYITNLREILNETGDPAGYEVEMEVDELERDVDYVFSVAAENSIGLGEYSDPSDSVSLESETIIYYIVAAVVGGVLLVVVVIVIVCVAVCCMKRMGKGKRRMIITDSNAQEITFHPPNNQYLQGAPGPIPLTDSIELAHRSSSPYYNSLGKLRHGGKEYSVDGVDEPDTHFKYIPKPMYKPTPPYMAHSSPAHSSLAHKQVSISSDHEKHYPESVLSDRAFSGSDRGTLGAPTAISHSTPVMNRDSYDMDSMPKNASYMTDV